MKKTKLLPAILGAAALTASVALPYNTFAESKTAEIKASVAETLSLTLSNDAVNLDLSDTTFQSDTITVTGSTNNAFGYTISFNVNNEYNDLKHANPQVDSFIPSITEDKVPADFPATSWGYSIDAENYKKAPLESTNIFETSAKGERSDTLTVGAKAAANTAAGDYENELLFTIIANTPSTFTLSDITYLQEMTPEVCANTSTPSVSDGANTPQYQLIDMRDNKTYWVAKLADGSCWMTQNLDLNLTTDMVLTPADTDITANWSPEHDTVNSFNDLPEQDGTHGTHNSSGGYYVWGASYDPGDYYYNRDAEDSCWWGASSLSACTQEYASTPFEANMEHGHVGNLYGYEVAAMAQLSEDAYYDGSSVSDGTQSICPKGWHLPIGGEDPEINEYTKVVATYYGQDEYYYAEYGRIGNSDVVDMLKDSPIYLTPAGQFDLGYYSDAGSGSFWTSYENEYNNQMFMTFDDDAYYGAGNRNYGPNGMASVRCVAY